jgi:cell wall-associated NlpC family hydrolase
MALPVLRLGSRGRWVRLLQTKLIARHIPVPGGADGIFGSGTNHAVVYWQRHHRLGADGIVGPRTWKSLGIHTGAPAAPPRGPTGKALALLFQQVVTGRYLGGTRPRYVFGGEENSFRDPRTWNRIDCSEGIQLCVGYQTGRLWVDGSWAQYAACRKVSVNIGINTPGALLFIKSRMGDTGQNRIHHVAVSLGDGRTAEARSAYTSPQCGVWSAHGRFNLAGLVPVLRY